MDIEIIKSLEELRELIEKPRQFLGVSIGLNKEECVLLIRKIHSQLPDAIKEAEQTLREKEKIKDSAQLDAHLTLERAKADGSRILELAEREAERILEESRIERERLIHESEILKAAKQEAEQIRAECQSEAMRVRRSADEYALDVLIRLENVVNKVLSTIERGKVELQRASSSTRQAQGK